MQDEIARRLGKDGQEMVEALANLSLVLDEIHDRALFRAAVRLGTELGGKPSLQALAVDAAYASQSGT